MYFRLLSGISFEGFSHQEKWQIFQFPSLLNDTIQFKLLFQVTYSHRSV